MRDSKSREMIFVLRACACALALASVPVGVRCADMSSVALVHKPHAAGTPWTASERATLARAIDRLVRAATLRGARVGMYVRDTVRGGLVYARDPDGEYMPASTFKLLVGSTALRRLGDSFAYVTSLASDAGPRDGIVTGNLYLRGGGDALLSTRDLGSAADAVAAAGIARVDGAIVTDATHDDDVRYGLGWSWDDIPYDYSPVIGALELDDGVAHVHMRGGPAAGTPVTLRIDPQSSAFSFDDRLTTGVTGSRDSSQIARPWDRPMTIRLEGSYPAGAPESGDLRPSVPDPAAYAGDALLQALAERGIAVTAGVRAGSTPADRAKLWTHASEPMPQLLADFWYPSDNLMGELLLKELGAADGGEPGSDAKGRIVETSFLRSIGVDPSTVTIADGSGLSSEDRITPRDLVTILQADWDGPERDVVLDALPVAGVRGTLRRAFVGTPAERVVFAKTGSIRHVRTLAGFVQSRSHGPVTFSLMVNDWMDESDAAALARVRGAIVSAMAVR